MPSESIMKARKTIKAKILELRKGKEELLRREYENFQRYLRGDSLLRFIPQLNSRLIIFLEG
jgi:hypothetical protein